MKASSSTPFAPYNYTRCFNAQCTKADNCLHRLAALHDSADYPSIRIINPLCFAEDNGPCRYFQSSEKIRVAWGISQLLDNVPHKVFPALKSKLIAHFGRGKYYRFYRKESYLTPEDQKFIQEMFRQYNVPGEPVFDEYSEEYRW